MINFYYFCKFCGDPMSEKHSEYCSEYCKRTAKLNKLQEEMKKKSKISLDKKKGDGNN